MLWHLIISFLLAFFSTMIMTFEKVNWFTFIYIWRDWQQWNHKGLQKWWCRSWWRSPWWSLCYYQGKNFDLFMAWRSFPFSFISSQKPNRFLSYSYLQVREDPVFRREGSDIHVDSVLSITQVMFLHEENIDSWSRAWHGISIYFGVLGSYTTELPNTVRVFPLTMIFVIAKYYRNPIGMGRGKGNVRRG